MIPNSAPMAAVYWRSNGSLFSRPVVAWLENDGEALTPNDVGKLAPASHTAALVQFLGLWYDGWSPSHDEMATLLPDYVPGTPTHCPSPSSSGKPQTAGWPADTTAVQ